MRLVIDLQGAQGVGRTRGIGRYSRELALAMARRAGGHDVIIALNGCLPNQALRQDFSAILPRGNIRTWHGPDDTGEGSPRDPVRRRAAEAIRAEFLASLQPDMLHVSSIFEGLTDDLVTGWPAWRTRPPIVATGYDLIPLIRRETYLAGPWWNGGTRHWYLRCLQEMRLTDAILAISASSRDEFIEHLDADPQHVYNIRAGIGTEFVPPDLTAAQYHALLRRLGLRPNFILYLGGGDYRKNEAGLIRAYGLLPQDMRARHQLVIVGKCGDDALRSTARAAGIGPSDLVLLHFVDEADLSALYGTCELFVLPSLHEGFGLPAAEAMACGAPVIASNTTSLPEVVGRADALFDPADPSSISERMRAVLENPGFRQELVSHAARQAATFTWPNSAALAWQAIEATLARLRHRSPIASASGWRLRLAYVSPVPPQQSGIADYSAELIPELARHYDITIVAEVPNIDNETLAPNFPMMTPSQFLAEADGFDRVLYHIGNSQFHASQLEDLLPRAPGTVTLHDAYLSGARNWVACRKGRGPAGFTEDLYRSHGWPAVLREMRDGLDAAIRDFPCSLPVLHGAIGVIQHSHHGRDILAMHFGREATRDIRIIPQLHQRFGGPDRRSARVQLGIPDDQFIVCSFGYVSPPKLPARLLAAWQHAALTTADARLVLVGQADGGTALMLKDMAANLGRPVEDLSTGYVDAGTYRTWLAAADVAVQLRTDSRGETSRAILDCMAAGLPTVVNDHGSAAELPADAVIRLPSGFTDAMLTDTLLQLRDPARRQHLAAKAREHVENNLSPRRIATAYQAAIEAFYADGCAAVRHRATRSLSYVLPPDGCSPAALAAAARAIARSFPTVQPARLLVDISACPRLQQGDPLGTLVTGLLSTHAADIRVDLVATGQGGWHYARAQAATLLGLPRPPAPDEPVDVAGVAALLCIVPPDGPYQEALDQIHGWGDVGIMVTVLLTAPPSTAACAEICGLAAQVLSLDPADVEAIDVWLAHRFPESGRSARAAGSATALMATLSRHADGRSAEHANRSANPVDNTSTVVNQGTGANSRRTQDSHSASPARSSTASRIVA